MSVQDGTQSARRVLWRSLESKDRPNAEPGSDITQSTVGADELLRLRRRNFLTLSGAMATLAGIEGCIRRPAEKIMPFSEAPEHVVPGVPLHYATVRQQRGEAVGLLVTSHEGRPTKVEGNPGHPASQGATGPYGQATILDLYDPERSRAPRQQGDPTTRAAAEAALVATARWAEPRRGQGLRILAQPSNSPSFMRLRKALLAKYPEARVHTYAPVNDANVCEGMKLLFGRPKRPRHVWAKADVVLALDSDFLLTESGSVAAARGFSDRRRMRSAEDSMNRLYVVEPGMSVTGANADHRLRLPAQDIERYARALAGALGDAELARVAGQVTSDGIDPKWLQVVAKDLMAHRGRSLIVAGADQPARVHALAFLMNRALGNVDRTVQVVDAVDPDEPEPFADIQALARDMEQGQVGRLVMLGGNPVYDAPADVGFEAALAKVEKSIHVSAYHDETSAKSSWHVPRAHELESWGDLRSIDGTVAVQQPLIAPLFDGFSDIEVLARLMGDLRTGHDLVRETFTLAGVEQRAWERGVQRGTIELAGAAALAAGAAQAEAAAPPEPDQAAEAQPREEAAATRAAPAGEPTEPVQDATPRVAALAAALQEAPAPSALSADNLELVFRPDNKLFDGRHANNGWLQELPDPVTCITWDNAALIGPGTAKELGVQSGDMLRLTVGERSLDIVAWELPGQAHYSIGLALGWGRARAGRTGSQQGAGGFNAYRLRTSATPHFTAGAKLQKLGERYPISQTQEHDSMAGRPVALDATLEEYQETPNFAEWEQPNPPVGPLWETVDYSEGQQWGMTIDLNSCIGCSACTLACQAENSVPVVGKEQVARGREMTWLRIDRYFVGDDEDDPDVTFQPVACQHCEEAPCENVCPVAATSHSPSGLNDMAYNRCIGTRYCMNNCPYKVRRFNFLNFNLGPDGEGIPEVRQMQYNPNVSLRFRGVMEKCTYCVQRIQAGRMTAKREGRELRTDEVVSACQQVCPTQAIAFGNLNDPNSEVARLNSTDRRYKLLADVGTRPRTTFLGKVRNPNPEMSA